jgi:hypothetical protein
MTPKLFWIAGVAAGVAGGILASTVYTAAAPATVGTREAVGVCDQHLSAAAEYGAVTSIALAEISRVSDVVAWQEHRHEPEISGVVSPLRGRSDGDATVCMYRGQFVTPTAPRPDGGRADSHNILRLVIVDDETVFDSAGYEGRMAPDTPSAAK